MFARFGNSLRTAVPRIRFLGIRESGDLFEPPYLEVKILTLESEYHQNI